jgi:hypothetical protein
MTQPKDLLFRRHQTNALHPQKVPKRRPKITKQEALGTRPEQLKVPRGRLKKAKSASISRWEYPALSMARNLKAALEYPVRVRARL